MAEVRLQFVLAAGMSSAVIAAFSAGHLSHVDAVLPDGRLLGARSDRVGGRPPGVQIRPPDYEAFKRRVLVSIPADAAQAMAFYTFLNRQLGKPYDREAIWAFAFNRDWHETDSWICSELQAAALQAAKIFQYPYYLAANKIVPVALCQTVSVIAPVT